MPNISVEAFNMQHPSSSSVQQGIEGSIVSRAARALKLSEPARKHRIQVGPDGSILELDGWVPVSQVALEVYSSVGDIKPGQRKKLMGDVLKLTLLRELKPRVRCYIVVTSDTALRSLASGWLGVAMKTFGIKVHLVELTGAESKQLIAAAKRQARGNILLSAGS